MAEPDNDGATVVAGAHDLAADKTVATRRKRVDRDDTVISRGGTADETMVSDTVASLSERRDRTRRIERGVARAVAKSTPGAPGLLAEGRVASKPGKHVERYPVRVAEAPPLAVVRQTVLPPLVEARRNLDAAAIAESALQKRHVQAVGVLVAVVGATSVAAAVVVIAIVLLSQR